MCGSAKLTKFVCWLGCLVSLNVTRGEEPYWRTRPGGCAAVSYLFPDEPKTEQQTGYYNLDFYFEVTKDPGNELGVYAIPEKTRGRDSYIGYYWANQFGFAGSKSGMDGYFGLQTVGTIHQASESDRANPHANRFVKSTRLAIFSIWNALDARPGGKGSYVAPYGHEGSGWSCKVEYPWREGVKYRLRIHELGDAKKPKEPEWWRASITDTSTKREVVIGDIKVPGDWGWLEKRASMFTEYYSMTVNQKIGDADHGKPDPRVCTFMPKAAIKIYPPTANNETVDLQKMTPRAYGKCAHVAKFYQSDNSEIASGTSIKPQAIINETGSLDRSTN